jgi:hypothetical protein
MMLKAGMWLYSRKFKAIYIIESVDEEGMIVTTQRKPGFSRLILRFINSTAFDFVEWEPEIDSRIGNEEI